MKRSFYNIEIPIDDQYYIYNTKLGSVVEMNADEYEEFKNIEVSKDEDFKTALLSEGVLTELSMDEEKELVKFRFDSSTWNDTNFNITILTTSDCNYKCYYCYENHLHREDMTKETADKTAQYIMDYIENRFVKEVSFTWIGGEPLKNIEPALNIYKKVKSAIENNPKVSISGNSVVTNGYYLSDGMLENLKVLDIEKIQITFDGGRETHEKVKPNSYDHLFKWVDKLSDNDIDVNVRVNIDKNSQKTFNSFIDDVKESPLFQKFIDRDISISPFPIYFFHEDTPTLNQMLSADTKGMGSIIETMNSDRKSVV